MRITLCNQKGGAGKTMVTMLLSMTLADAGRKVGIVDLDVQGSSTQWANTIDNPNIVILDEDSDEECDVIFYDTPPNLGDGLLSVVKQSDLTIIVTSPSPSDVWSTKSAADFLNKKAKKAKKMLLFNKVEKGRRTSENLAELSEMIGLEALDNNVPYYAAYQHAALFGWSALKAKDIKPLVNVALEILSLNK